MESLAQKITVLLIEDDADFQRLIKEVLLGNGRADVEYQVEPSALLNPALERLARGGVDVIITDLGLPDSPDRNKTFEKLRPFVETIPTIILTGMDDEELAIDMVRQGAQDYLVKSSIRFPLLSRVIRYAVERHKIQDMLRAFSLTDDLTGFYNRRGFLLLAEQQKKTAERQKKGFSVFFADLNGLKKINDTHGHEAGDTALVDIARIFERVFRTSDILARLGGDEFAIIAIQCNEKEQAVLIDRLHAHLQAHNTRKERPYELGVSVGAVYFDPLSPSPVSIKELLAAADKRLYEVKKSS